MYVVDHINDIHADFNGEDVRTEIMKSKPNNDRIETGWSNLKIRM